MSFPEMTYFHPHFDHKILYIPIFPETVPLRQVTPATQKVYRLIDRLQCLDYQAPAKMPKNFLAAFQKKYTS
jgi:hypothetical protein